jgi:saccharopine dehydrogenase-like NADP-dependent oxidoreductase
VLGETNNNKEEVKELEIQEIKNYKRIPLGQTDVYFLYLISKGEKSAYEILISEKKIGRTISYKNVHEKVKRLESFGLIE